ncbi:MAG: hypothetical protein QGF99_11580 [Acidimicrobiales bacterium]|jgi:hypothetical protein|nr:hypothetical protein [Acidimicrobiales bacterium]MDP6902618.1 hypothetical protein [Acidimicrobiales bacterium]HJL99746.1 hypothetical protein [Acidimicrobiales bacterium]
MSLLDAASEQDALEQLHDLGCTDGLPVVIPTAERVARMVLATGYEGDLVLGVMGPLHGSATIEKVSTAAVMAGCLPDHAPVVVAAVRAVCQPEFDLTEMQATTHCTAPLLIVCGPARHVCGGIASGFGAMGPGHRANASIGRALRLAMINIGGARPGSSDMALHGHPGKFTYCVAEDEENSPFPGLHTTFGYQPEDSAVIVTGAEAPHSTFFTGDRDDPASVEGLLDVIALVMANPGSNNVHLRDGAITVIMNPDHAEVIRRAGLTRQDVQAELARRATISVGTMRRISPSFYSQGMRSGGEDSDDVADDELIHVLKDPNRILLLQAGGSGLYTMVMPSWCAGPHRNAIVHAQIELDQACEVPGMNDLTS